MRGLIATLSCLCVMAAVAPAHAQMAQKIGNHDQWATYSFQESDSGKVCYALAAASKMVPATLNHGDIYFLVSQRPGKNIVYEPQFRAGYDLQANSKVIVTIGDRSFTMSQLNRPGGSAWLENPAEEPMLVAAMRGGASMQVKAVSGRGNATSYEFSLRGISAALDSIRNCQ